MNNNVESKKIMLQKEDSIKRFSREDIMKSLQQMVVTNSNKSNALIIDNLTLKYSAGFRLAKEREFTRAKSICDNADATLENTFNENSFEFYYCQLLAISTKSYLEFRLGNKDLGIELTKKGIEYAILLQDYISSNNIGLFVSQMLMNLAKIHLYYNEINKWQSITIENIHFLTNFTLPMECENFKIEDLKKASLRYFMLIEVINEALINVVKYKVINGHDFINSIVLKEISEPVIAQINSWKELNVALNQYNTKGNEFIIAWNNFLSSENGRYDLQILKLSLKNRIKKEGVQLHGNTAVY